MSYKVKSRRRLEICVLIFLAIVLSIATVVIVTLQNIEPSLSEKCGPKFPHFSVNISDAEETSDGSYVSSDGMTYSPGTYWTSNGHIFGCPCSVKPCIRKCCNSNEGHRIISINTSEGVIEKMKCFNKNTSFDLSELEVVSMLSITEGNNDLQLVNIDYNHFYILYGKPCKLMIKKQPEYYDEDLHYLTDDGRIYTMDSSSPFRDQSKYCLESKTDNDSGIYTYECTEESSDTIKEQEEKWTFDVLLGGMLVSIPCLVITFLVYAFLPQQHNLHGKCLMCHVFCLTVAYTTLACVQFPEGPFRVGESPCIVAAFVMQYSFLGSFFWLNAMSFDIWWVFSGLMSQRGSTKFAQCRKFILYSIYAWGVPLLITLFTAFMEYTRWVPTYLVKPLLGRNRCWFYKFNARVLYFYLPIGVLIIVNIVMFSTTSFRLHLRNTDADKLNNKDSKRHNVSDRHRFNLYLNLFIVMGVTWVMEVVSFAVGGPRVYWIIFDLANSLQGVLIFVIFVCKRRILHQLNRRICPGITLIGPTPSMKYNGSRTTSSRLSGDTVMVKLRKISSTRT